MSRNIIISVDEFYHVYNRGNDKREIFLDEKDFLRFQTLLYVCNNIATTHISNFQNTPLKKLYSIPREDNLVYIGAYCLMPNHYHLLIKEKIEGGTSLFMQKLSTAYTMYFNKKYGKTGSLFGGRFKAKHLDSDEYLKYQFSYIHLNPVSIIDSSWKDGKITSIKKAKDFLGTYRYSSYCDYLNKERLEKVILDKVFFPDYFAGQTRFSSMIDECLRFALQEGGIGKVEPCQEIKDSQIK